MIHLLGNHINIKTMSKRWMIMKARYTRWSIWKTRAIYLYRT